METYILISKNINNVNSELNGNICDINFDEYLYYFVNYFLELSKINKSYELNE